MSQENVEIVRRVYEAVARRDSATVLELYDPDVEWDFTRHPFGTFLGGTIHRGHDGLRAFFGGMEEVWENVEFEIADLFDAGEHVVLIATQRTRGRISGVPTEDTAVGVWTIRKGKVVRVVWF
jgi:uncharacterized protein